MARKKYEAVELYVQIIKNVKRMLERERDWLEGGGCSDKVAQHRLVSNLEATLETLKENPGPFLDLSQLNK
jgi:hypothetical protein